MSATVRNTVFDRVVCGVDSSDAGVAAARVAGLVTDPNGALTLVSVNDSLIAAQAGWRMAPVLDELAVEAKTALERARREVAPLHALDAKLVEGDPLRGLMEEIASEEATAVVVGSHGHSRAAGIALGSVSTHLLHEAPCAVLIARGSIELERWPRRIVVGVDGSTDSAAAFEAATALGSRFDAEVRAIFAAKDAHAELEAARRIAADCEEHDARAIDALSVASERADLVVVGSRGRRGLRALGSLSERLAHEARCSVLVVRTPR